MISKTKTANYVTAALFIGLGILLDGSHVATVQVFHHAAFLTAGVFIGMGVRR